MSASKREKRPPQNLPSVGDDVRLRGRRSVGKLIEVNDQNKWATVDWDPTKAEPGPKLCHLYELERLAESASVNPKGE
jgi:hypothetical protein